VRRDFKYGKNHIPIQNFYLQDVVKNRRRQAGAEDRGGTIVENNQDRFVNPVQHAVKSGGSPEDAGWVHSPASLSYL
jgi:hypothetical protein